MNMFVYDLSLSQGQIPNLNTWITPNFTGYGDLIIDRELGKNKQNDPKKFKDDFPEYIYSYENLRSLPWQMIKLEKITTYKNLYEKDLQKEFNAESFKSDFLKMFELMLFLDINLEKINASKNKKFSSFHIAEEFGNFIFSINHYLRTNYPKINWEWFGSYYRELYNNTIKNNSLLVNKYKEKFLYGAEADGEITPSNIITFKSNLNQKINLFTSNKLYIDDLLINYFGYILTGLNILAENGVMIIKCFNNESLALTLTIDLLYLLSCCFKRLLIVKPETANIEEIFIVALDYKKNLTELQLQRLMNIYQFFKQMPNVDEIGIFKKKDIPDDFLEKILDVNKKIIKLLENTKNPELDSFKEKKSKEWINKMKIIKINHENKLLF